MIPALLLVFSAVVYRVTTGLLIHSGASWLSNFAPLAALALVGCVGVLLQNRASLKTLLPASIVGSTIFYAITNAFSWLHDPGYAKNFAGLVQSLTVGLPQYSATPSWMFFRNSLVS